MSEEEQQEDMNLSDSDHNLLIKLVVITDRIDKWCSNHDVHHFRYNLMAWGLALTAIVGLILFIVTK